MNKVAKLIFFTICVTFFLSTGTDVFGQTTGTGSPGLRIDISGSNEEGDFGVAIQLVVAMTLLTLGPSILMMMTCFTRIVIVLGFVRNAVGVNAAPSSQIIVGLALFLTFFVADSQGRLYNMSLPTWLYQHGFTSRACPQPAGGEAGLLRKRKQKKNGAH